MALTSSLVSLIANTSSDWTLTFRHSKNIKGKGNVEGGGEILKGMFIGFMLLTLVFVHR